MPSATAGKLGRTTIGGTNCSNDRWKVTYHAVDIPTTNFESLAGVNAIGVNPLTTFEEGITGPYGADGEVSGYYDIDNLFQPFNNPLALFPGVYTPAGGMQLYTRKAVAASAFNFPSMRILQSVVDVDVNGRTNFAFSFKNNRLFAAPLA